jgi:predicted DNA-binding ribbon-helix-helix protein
LENALENQDAERVRSICAYLERVASNAKTDADLEGLLRVEIGEWLGRTTQEQEVAPCLGEQTKRICRYVPGLATQRVTDRAEKARRNPIMRLLNRHPE